MGREAALTQKEYSWVIGLHDGRVRVAERRLWRAAEGRKTTRAVGSRRAAAAATGDYFAAEHKTKFSVKASVRTVQRLLKNVGHLVYTKMNRTLPLTAAHKSARMAWAEEHITNLEYG
ncbi:hypothetical protein PPTG_22565 [Phytophthora nicotianae INRA-310]|uniref:Transposase Tc1-like domain-containing protein n=1 Tax=Phytophthora nicotianae (strain INRA-310) TaxID=761204 RepID=W2QGT3_PHYN3|nr:hypothetical protein PPTG_22565 [Phytophthora nicotianae INRA-310]ETN12081.1 hypothetical protein PPTG_22565 [Phytophthora nicotianae INRA-310]